MESLKTENFLSRILAFGAAFTTIFLVNDSVTDPVNAPKMVAIGGFGCAAIAVVIGSKLFTRFKDEFFTLVTVCFFVISLLISVFASKAPLTQNLYGVYGRNNGLLTYVFLILILMCALTLRELHNFERIIKALILAGLINVLYCLWVIAFGDFLSWNNPYGSILGTFGNPNFIGAFLGIIFSIGFALLIDTTTRIHIRLLLLVFLPICAFEIWMSRAVQGRVVAAFGCALITFLYIRSRYGKLIVISYSLVSLTIGGFAVAGTLQHGPFTQFLYKTSVSLRGQYWLAGWNTGHSHPWTGVGMDTFGDWYRRTRDIRAIELPGVNVVVNTAHNVPMDMFAFGGWPLLISYVFLMGIAGFYLLKYVRRHKEFDVVFAILASAWAGYQLQSIISINQIGLAVWGWLLSGALIAYEKSSRTFLTKKSKELTIKIKVKEKSTRNIPAQIPVFAFVGLILGLFIALPPLTGDIQWRSAQKVQTLQALENSLKPSYFNPQNSMKYMNNIGNLEQNNFGDLARKYSLEAIKWNSDFFDFWRIYYQIQSSSSAERKEALKNMRRLDPLNPDLTSTK